MSLSDPQNFYRLAGKVIPWILGLALVLFVVGFYLGFFVCPVDARQGNSYRIIFIHVSAAWLSMLLYVLMAVFSAIGLWRNNRICFMLAQAMAPTGALMAFIALFSGAFWGRPTWGTYWVWDARLTSELILFFLYLGFIALHSAIDDKRRADRAASAYNPPGSITQRQSGIQSRRLCRQSFRWCQECTASRIVLSQLRTFTIRDKGDERHYQGAAQCIRHTSMDAGYAEKLSVTSYGVTSYKHYAA